MNERDFYELMRVETEIALKAMGKDKHLKLQEVTKANGVFLTGLCEFPSAAADNMSPIVYLNDAYDSYLNGKSVDFLAKDLAAFFVSLKNPGIEVKDVHDYEKIKDHIIPRLAGFKENEVWLKNKVYERFGDFAVYFYVQMGDCRLGSYGAAITNAYLNDMGVEKEELILKAKENLALLDYRLTPIEEILSEQFGMDVPKMEGPSMLILTSMDLKQGAVFLTREDVLNCISERIGGDFYVLPSSVHEVIILPADTDTSLNELSEMVKAINENEVSAEDKLSDYVQYYDASTKVLENAQRRAQILGEKLS